ncbi:threonine/serine exporter family protein [Arthrobacter sp. zg-Y411]|uniref:threonine/serine ThrE exporter family protein n=1 Tax=Arthrobacter zhangbolii TaxID=2886936 RepID=UPI001D147EEA|nr:threonine/serine exporter family protein [Arthrobacter zhangbolii]MCC3296041.1 threonine/serine exporter family protein [Arthrobacter zhangbolii]
MENTSGPGRGRPGPKPDSAPNPDPVAGLIPVVSVPAGRGARAGKGPGPGAESRGQGAAAKSLGAAAKAPAPPSTPPGRQPTGEMPTAALRSTRPKPPPPTTSVIRPAGAKALKPERGRKTADPREKRPARTRKTVPSGIAPAGSTAVRTDRSSAAARRMLRRLVQGESPPTQAMSIVERLAGSPYANPLVRSGTDANARKTLDLALSLAETMFRYGAGALEVETAIIAVTAAFGLESIEVDITNQSVLLNYSPKDQTPITVMRVVRSWTNNYAGLGLVHQLVTEIIDGGLSRAEAANRLNEITHRPKPFPRWAVTFSAGIFAAAIVGFIGGGPLASLVGFAGTVMVSLLQRVLGRWRVPDFFTTAASGFVVTAMAMIFWSMEVPISPGIVVAGGILLMLPTGRLVSAVQDAINGFPVTASGRFLSAFLTFGALVAGIAVALVMGALFGMARLDVTDVASSQYSFPVTLLLLAVALATICIVEQSPRALVLPTVLIGLAGFLVYQLAEAGGVGPRLTPAVSAIFIGMVARIVALRMGAPQLIVAVPAVLFLFPGLAIFRSMYGLSIDAEDMYAGAVGLFDALTVILAISGGVVLGDNLGRPFTRNLNGNDRRNRRR